MNTWKEITDSKLLQRYFHYPTDMVISALNTFYKSSLESGGDYKIIAFFIDKNFEQLTWHFLFIDDGTLVAFDDYNPIEDGGVFGISLDEGEPFISIMEDYRNKLLEFPNDEETEKEIIKELNSRELYEYKIPEISDAKYYRLNAINNKCTVIRIVLLSKEALLMCAFKYKQDESNLGSQYLLTGTTSQISFSKKTMSEFINIIKNYLMVIK